MQNPNTTDSNQALAANSDTVYGISKFEHMFETDIEAASDEQVQAETTPHRLTQMATAGAGNPTSAEDFAMTLSTLRQQYRNLLADQNLNNLDVDLSSLALVCAQHAITHLAHTFTRLSVDDRYDLVWEWFQCDRDDQAREFWNVLANILHRYAGHWVSSDWEPMVGIFVEDGALSMPVWQTDAGDHILDLLVFLTPWDPEDAVEQAVREAMSHAHSAYGFNVIGVRLIPVFSAYLSRWYFPDLSWVPLACPSSQEGRES